MLWGIKNHNSIYAKKQALVVNQGFWYLLDITFSIYYSSNSNTYGYEVSEGYRGSEGLLVFFDWVGFEVFVRVGNGVGVDSMTRIAEII
jgi:hypothetical protein